MNYTYFGSLISLNLAAYKITKMAFALNQVFSLTGKLLEILISDIKKLEILNDNNIWY